MSWEKGWFATLIDRDGCHGLLSTFEYQKGNIVICRGDTRKFRAFDDYIEFGRYLYDLPPEDRVFFEVILERSPQKFYLDIDASSDDISLEDSIVFIEYLVEEVGKLFLEVIGKRYPILVYSSHGAGNDHKISYHIIVDGICLLGCHQNKILFSRLMERLDDRKRFIDGCLFKRVQQMRIWTCTKHGHDRYKRLTTLSTDANGKQFVPPTGMRETKLFLSLLGSSLISHTLVCDILPAFPEPPRQKIEIDSDAEVQVDDDLVVEIMSLYCRYHDLDSCPFDFLNVAQEDGFRAMVLCKRIAPSWCERCKRVHENENAYFLVWGNEYHVSFCCRRHERNLYLGALRKVVKEEVVEQQEPGPSVFERLQAIRPRPLDLTPPAPKLSLSFLQKANS
jgi:hypothetical protein